jgi:hypothetical protein
VHYNRLNFHHTHTCMENFERSWPELCTSFQPPGGAPHGKIGGWMVFNQYIGDSSGGHLQVINSWCPGYHSAWLTCLGAKPHQWLWAHIIPHKLICALHPIWWFETAYNFFRHKVIIHSDPLQAGNHPQAVTTQTGFFDIFHDSGITTRAHPLGLALRMDSYRSDRSRNCRTLLDCVRTVGALRALLSTKPGVPHTSSVFSSLIYLSEQYPRC